MYYYTNTASGSSIWYYLAPPRVAIVYFDWVNMKFAVRDENGNVICRGSFEDVVRSALQVFNKVVILKDTFPDIVEVSGKVIIPRGQSQITIFHILRSLRENETYDVLLNPSDHVILNYEVDDIKLVIKLESPKEAPTNIEVWYRIEIVMKEPTEV